VSSKSGAGQTGFYESVAAVPRITMQFNRARKHLEAALKDQIQFLNEFEREMIGLAANILDRTDPRPPTTS
jgi:hypothetical protein